MLAEVLKSAPRALKARDKIRAFSTTPISLNIINWRRQALRRYSDLPGLIDSVKTHGRSYRSGRLSINYALRYQFLCSEVKGKLQMLLGKRFRVSVCYGLEEEASALLRLQIGLQFSSGDGHKVIKVCIAKQKWTKCAGQGRKNKT